MFNGSAITKTPLYIRLSVSDRCNLQCLYCRDGLALSENGKSSGLCPEEQIELLKAIASLHPIFKIRITGGEPLLYQPLERLICLIRDSFPLTELCLTTNGTLLAMKATALRKVGLNRINISLDSSDPSGFCNITGGGELHRVIAGIDASRKAGFEDLRLNCVMLKNRNGNQLADLVRLADSFGALIRFIELMPFGVAKKYFSEEFVSAEDALRILSEPFSYAGFLKNIGTTAWHQFLDENGRSIQVGFISPVSAPFCLDCNRLRLDRKGHLFSCLRKDVGVDLFREMRLRGQAGVKGVLERCLFSKCTHHHTESNWPEGQMCSLGG